jgi:hypothetical protein
MVDSVVTTVSTEPTYQDTDNFNYLKWWFVSGIVTTVLEIFGIFGNIITAVVLMLPSMRSSTSILLVVLSVYDTICLIIYMITFSLPDILKFNEYWFDYFYIVYEFMLKYFYGVYHVAYTGTIYMTVVITLERGLVVLFPLHAKNHCTKTRALYASLFILIWSVFYNIPPFLTFVEETDKNNSYSEYTVKTSDFGTSHFYSRVYLIYLNSVFQLIIPFGVISILNIAIIYRICIRKREIISPSRRRNVRQIRLAIMIIVLMSIFLLPRLFFVVFYFMLMEVSNKPCGMKCVVIYSLANFCVVLNSATNFIVYNIFGTKFRRSLRNLCACKCRGFHS